MFERQILSTTFHNCSCAYAVVDTRKETNMYVNIVCSNGCDMCPFYRAFKHQIKKFSQSLWQIKYLSTQSSD